jgi:CBS domain containing-hemolysin-like protein
MAIPGATPVEPETTLRDALSAMLASSVQLGAVVDARGTVIGLISVDQISEILQQARLPQRAESPVPAGD